MDKERLMNYFDHHYLPKRDVLNRIPLGASLDAFWQELVNRRRSKATILPMHSPQGGPYWFVVTDNMIAASEKIVEEAMRPCPYTDAAILEEAFYTSFVEGSQMSIEDAVAFMKNSDAPKDIHEQLLFNNRQAISLAMENAYRPVTEDLIRALAGILTSEMDEGGSAFRETDTHMIPSMGDEPYTVPGAAAIPGMTRELCAYLADPGVHPLLKAAVAHAWFMAVRPFPEGNERLARVVATMILIRAQYLFFNEISLSALIAQDGFGYYDAVGNLLRTENGGDWTYLVEYYVVLLGKAIYEIHERRLNREAEMARQSLEEAEQPVQVKAKPEKSQPARTENVGETDQRDHPDAREEPEAAIPPENPVQASTSGPPAPQENKDEPFQGDSDGVESTEDALKRAGFFSVGASEMDPEQSIESDISEPIPYMEFRRRLEVMAARPSEFLSAVSKRLLCFMADGKYTLSKEDVTAGIVDGRKRIWNIITHLRRCGILVTKESVDGVMLYRLNVNREYGPEMLNTIQMLRGSNTSLKDRRIGDLLFEKLDEGSVDIVDYRNRNEESKWQYDMKLCQQLGLVTRITAERYEINETLRRSYERLDQSQKSMATRLYETFGHESFTSEMIVATLDYSSTHTHATLHTFTLMGILDCTQGDAFTYRFLVTPEEHPECFAPAA